MRITLIRHGKPNIARLGKLRISEIHLWIASYDSADLDLTHEPSKEVIEIAQNCHSVVCSDLRRSIESAQALGVSQINHIDSTFREVGLPYGNFPSPKLSPHIWTVFLRILWFLGYSKNSESFREARTRAKKGAKRLKEMAEKNNSVLLVGHGFINRFIAKELLSNGWQGPVSPGRKYWEFGIYQYSA